MFDNFKEVLSEFGRGIGERLINLIKLRNQKRNKENHDLEVKYNHLEELYELENDYVEKLNSKDNEKHKLIYKLELEHIRHEIALLKLEIKELERTNHMDESEKEFESLNRYQRWEEEYRHRNELEKLEREALVEMNQVQEGFLKRKKKDEIEKIRNQINHELNTLNEQIKREYGEYNINELDQKKRDELELSILAEESRHNIEVLNKELAFLKSKDNLSEKEIRELNRLELLKQQEESRHKLFQLKKEVEKRKIENKISEEDEKLIFEKLKDLLKNKEVDITTQIEIMIHETNKRIEELNFLKEKNRLSLKQIQELNRLELEKTILAYAHEIKIAKENINYLQGQYTIEEDKQKEDNIIGLLNKRNFDFSDKNAIIKEILDNLKNEFYVVSLFKHINTSLYSDKEFMEQVIKIQKVLFEFASSNLKKDRSFISNVIEYNSDAIRYANLDAQNDVNYILELLKKTNKKFELLESCSYQVRTSDKILDYVLKYDTKCIKFITPVYHNAQNAIINILKNDNSLIKYVSHDVAKALNLGENKDFVLICLKGNYYEFKDLIADKFKGDLELAKEVIGKDNKSIIWFNEIVLNNEEIMMNLIDSDVNNIIYIGNKLLNNEELVVKIINENGLYSNIDFAERLLRMRGQYIKYFSHLVKSDKRLVLIALSNAGAEIKNDIDPQLLLDEAVNKAIEKLDIKAINYVKLIKAIDNNRYRGWKYEFENGNPYVRDYQMIKKVIDIIDSEDDAYDMYTIINNPQNEFAFYLNDETHKSIIDNMLLEKVKNNKGYYEAISGRKLDNTIPVNRLKELIEYIIDTDDIDALSKYQGNRLNVYQRIYGDYDIKPDDVWVNYYNSAISMNKTNFDTSYRIRVDWEFVDLLKQFVSIYGYKKINNYLNGDNDIINNLIALDVEKSNKNQKS